jgi:hypothetical protein
MLIMFEVRGREVSVVVGVRFLGLKLEARQDASAAELQVNVETGVIHHVTRMLSIALLLLLSNLRCLLVLYLPPRYNRRLRIWVQEILRTQAML